MSSTVFYFAYGSNLHPVRLRQRTPSCRAVGCATLPGYDLRFHKRSSDPSDFSGKCDVVEVSDAHSVRGVVYEIHSDEVELLHEAEGPGYRYSFVDVFANEGEVRAFCYFARQSHIDDSLKPYTWYRDFLLLGARHHGFPANYMHRIEALDVLDDHDEARARRNRRLARALGARD